MSGKMGAFFFPGVQKVKKTPIDQIIQKNLVLYLKVEILILEFKGTRLILMIHLVH